MAKDFKRQMTDLAFIKEIAQGVSTQARFANRLWLSLMLFALVVLPQMLNHPKEIKLPFGLGQVDATVVYLVSCPIMAVLLVTFLNAHVQQARATIFGHRMINELSKEYDSNAWPSDLRIMYDIMRLATFIRVSPLPLLPKDKYHFNPENCPNWLSCLTKTYYLALKCMGLLVYIFLPSVLLVVLFVFYLGHKTATLLRLPIGLFVLVALIASVHTLYFEARAIGAIVEKNWPRQI